MDFSRHIVYIDILFITNFIINYFLLFCCARMLKIDKKEVRLVLSSLLGGVYSVCMFFPELSVLYTIFFKFLFSVSMVCFAFGFKNIKRFIRILFSFYVICFAFGGGAFALYYFTDISNRINILFNNGVFYMELSLPLLLLFIAISFLLVNYVFWLFKDKANKDNLYTDIEIFLNNKSCIIKAFLDTGNMLKNPLSNKGVIVCQLNCIEGLIPSYYIKFFKGDYDMEKRKDDENINIMLLPYCSLGESEGVIPSFRADKIKFKVNGEQQQIENVFIAVSKNKLSTDDSYFALVNPTMIHQ